MRRTMEDLKIKEQRMSTVFAKFDYSMRYLDRWERREGSREKRGLVGERERARECASARERARARARARPKD